MVDYSGKIKIGIIILAGLILIVILLAALDLIPGVSRKTTSADASDEEPAVYELSWTGQAYDHLAIDDFDAFMAGSTRPILIDFWAEWCGPCRESAPIVEAIAKQYSGRVHVVKINTDFASGIANAFGVTGIPNFVIVNDGQTVDQVTGFGPELEQTLSQMLDKALG